MKKLKSLFGTKKRRIIAIVVCIVLVAGAVGGYIAFAKKGGEDFMTEGGVEAQMLSMQDLSGHISTTGTVESQSVVAVTTNIERAIIEELNVTLGQRVEEGEALCKFDAEDIKRQINDLASQKGQASSLEAYEREVRQRSLREAENNLGAAGATRNAAWTEYETAKRIKDSAYVVLEPIIREIEEKKYLYPIENNYTEDEISKDVILKSLRDKCEGPQKRYDTAMERFNAAQAALDSANTEVSSAQSALQSQQDDIRRAELSVGSDSDSNTLLRDLQNQLEKTTITASQSGIVTQLNVEKGAMATGTIMQIADDKNLRIKVPIRERDITKLSEGMTATITTDAMPDMEFHGVVSQVINFSTGEVTGGGDYMAAPSDSSSGGGYSAYVDIDPGSELLLGMTVRVEISTGTGGVCPAVPYDAIMSDDTGTYVLRGIPQSGDKYLIERVDIELGQVGDYYSEIISNELTEGDYIITTPWMVMEGDVTPVIISGDIMIEDMDSYEGE